MKDNITKSVFFRISLIALTVIIGIGVGLWQTMTPLPPGENSPYYSAYKRMLANIERFTTEPHPSGSAEIEKVREYIIAEIESMGCIPIIEEKTYTVHEIADLIIASYGVDRLDDTFITFIEGLPVNESGNVNLKNIFVKLESPGADSIMLFESHYDSANDESPGASDDMRAVCAQLEAIRNQANNTSLKTNLYFLFADAEEIGILGARAFVEAHPELKEKISVVVDMDASGGGPMLLGQVHPSFSFVQMMIKSGARPFTSSLVVALGAKGTSNFEAFRTMGYEGKGLCFSASSYSQNAHTMNDSYQNMDKATVWHFLHTTLSLANYAANNSLANINDSPQEGIYAPLMSRAGLNLLMILPVAYALAILPCALALAWAVLQIMRKQFKVTFSVIVQGLLVICSIGTTILLIEGNYLFSIPLLVITITRFLEERTHAHIIAKVISGIITLMLWTPVIYVYYMAVLR
jgi:hypothetical protein